MYKASSSVSFINLVSNADTIVQLVMLLLALASLWSWTIIFDKLLKFSVLKDRSDKFEDSFETMMLEDIYNKTKSVDNHPLSRVFMACMK